MMRSRQTTFKPLFRVLATVTLLGWTGALVVCTAHCSLGLSLGHGDGNHASCHGTKSLPSQHDEGDSSRPAGKKSAPSASCLTLKSALVNDHAATLTQPELPLLLALALIESACESTPVETPMPLFRQAQPRDWLFTPEVYLGPAFRSLAPPILS